MSLQTLVLACLLLVSGLRQAEPWNELWRAGQRGQAIQALQNEVDAAPDTTIQLRVQLVHWQLAAAQFEGALAGTADLPKEHRGLRGRALYFLARYEESLAFLSPEHPTDLRMRVAALKYLGRFDEVHSLLPKMRTVLGSDSVDVLLVEARDHQRKRDYAAAAAAFLKVRGADPLEPEALFGLGQCYLRLDRKDEARTLLESHRRLIPLLDALDFAQRGVDIAPSSGPNQASVASAYADLVPFSPATANKAIAAYERATQLATAAERTPIALRFARFHWEVANDGDAAIRVLTQALAHSTDPRLRVRKSDYLEQSGRKAEALQELKSALVLRPGDPAILQRIARIEGQ